MNVTLYIQVGSLSQSQILLRTGDVPMTEPGTELYLGTPDGFEPLIAEISTDTTAIVDMTTGITYIPLETQKTWFPAVDYMLANGWVTDSLPPWMFSEPEEPKK